MQQDGEYSSLINTYYTQEEAEEISDGKLENWIRTDLILIKSVDMCSEQWWFLYLTISSFLFIGLSKEMKFFFANLFIF